MEREIPSNNKPDISISYTSNTVKLWNLLNIATHRDVSLYIPGSRDDVNMLEVKWKNVVICLMLK